MTRASTAAKTHCARFTGMADFLASLPGHGKARGARFTGGESFEDSRRNCVDGWPHIVARAEGLLDQIEASGLLAAGQPAYVLDVAGAFPCVPAYLAGVPDNMFRRAPSTQMGEQSPLTLYLDVCVSAGVSAKQLTERGIAILTLVLALSRVRPVDLCLYATLGASGEFNAIIPIVPIATAPLDVSSATYALASAGFLRNLCFAYAEPRGFDGNWAWHQNPMDRAFRDRVRGVLDAQPQDLVIYGGHVSDPHIAQPVEWLKEQLALHLPQGDAE